MKDAPKFGALIEIRRNPNGTLPLSLISAAYVASRSATVLLVLHAISRAEIDEALDPIVSASARDVRGVQYADFDDDATTLPAALSTPDTFASSDAFRAKLQARGIQCRNPAELLGAFSAEITVTASPGLVLAGSAIS